ncbi:MAG: sulfur oxidation c-type cytochrome SoxA, partial [Pseudomonadota bacterium]
MRYSIAALSGLALAASGALAGPGPDDDKLLVEGEEIATEAATPEGHPLDRLYSGWRYRSDETQSLQTDDFENPAMVAVEYGEELWETPAGAENKSCADCHGDVSELAGLRAVMPKWSDEAGKPQALEQWINHSITTHQGADPWKWESAEMLAMTALIGLQSRGMPMAPETGGRMQEWQDKGETLYYTRVGQLDMACNQCHEDNNGQMIRADHLSQGNV